MEIPILDLERYQVSKERGFIPLQDPLVELPSRFKTIDELASSIPALLENQDLRSELEQLTAVTDFDNLAEPELRAVFRDLCFLASAYVHTIEEEPINSIPEGIAAPLVEIAARLDQRPILSYDSYAPWNFYRTDPEKGMEVENLRAIRTFTGTCDESWFSVVHTAVETQLGPAIKAIGLAKKAIAEENSEQVEENLRTVTKGLDQMWQTLIRMHKGTNRDVFFHQFRPYIMGFDNVVYAGQFDKQPQSFPGETGAQSPFIPYFDTALEIDHSPKSEKFDSFIADMMNHMPVPHRQLIRDASKGPSIRQYAERGGSVVRGLYNEAVGYIAQFRQAHERLVDAYITRMSPKGQNALGTAGAPRSWLTKQTKETKAAKLS